MRKDVFRAGSPRAERSPQSGRGARRSGVRRTRPTVSASDGGRVRRRARPPRFRADPIVDVPDALPAREVEGERRRISTRRDRFIRFAELHAHHRRIDVQRELVALAQRVDRQPHGLDVIDVPAAARDIVVARAVTNLHALRHEGTVLGINTDSAVFNTLIRCRVFRIVVDEDALRDAAHGERARFEDESERIAPVLLRHIARFHEAAAEVDRAHRAHRDACVQIGVVLRDRRPARLVLSRPVGRARRKHRRGAEKQRGQNEQHRFGSSCQSFHTSLLSNEFLLNRQCLWHFS